MGHTKIHISPFGTMVFYFFLLKKKTIYLFSIYVCTGVTGQDTAEFFHLVFDLIGGESHGKLPNSICGQDAPANLS